MVSIFVEDTARSANTDNLYESEQARYKRKDLDQLITQGVTYLIVRDDFYNMYMHAKLNQYPPVIKDRIETVNKFYDTLFLKFDPIVTFNSGAWRKGPNISIYNISGE